MLKRILQRTTTTTLGSKRPFAHRPLSTHERLLVIGSGVAGSTAALIAAETHRIPVTMLYAGAVPTDCNSYWAQGGIIYRGNNPDSPDLLAQDIHRAGAGLCVDAAVRKVAHEGPARVQEILLSEEVFANVPFDRDGDGVLELCLEASHAARRILHTGDHTGKSITEHITAAAARHPLITMQGDTVVTDLIESDGLCVGVETLNGKNEYASYGTLLATGGLAGIYQHSTNPSGFNALGSSVALATRAGLETQDLEYVQFHPTALNVPGQPVFLLTEALRGEGAILRDSNGRAFARDYHESGELAPRDIVARAVFNESQKGTVYLDVTHHDADWLYKRFPSINEHLSTKAGLDMARDPLPITPAAHYTCGGVTTDLNGVTTLPNCYAAGEAARTGLHGGNRLASTSLLEGLVFGATVSDFVAQQEHTVAEAARSIEYLPQRFERRLGPRTDESALELLDEVKRVMWDNVGVIRTTLGLKNAISELESFRERAARLHSSAFTKESAAVRDATTAGHAVALAADANTHSVGAHCLVEEYEEEEQDAAFAQS